MNGQNLRLVCALLAGMLTGCQSERLNPSDGQTGSAQECGQMRQRLLDQTLTPAQTAEITKNMEKAGCGRRLPGP
jgi:hypothetical protein